MILGILVLICGGNFLANPLATLATVSFLVGLFFLVVGFVSGFTVFIERKETKRWIIYLVLNIILVIIGILMISKLKFTLPYIWLITGFGFLVEAIIAIFKAFEFKKNNEDGWIYMLIFGILVGFFSLVVLGNPLFGLNFIATIVAAAVICFGIYLIVISFQTKPPKK